MHIYVCFLHYFVNVLIYAFIYLLFHQLWHSIKPLIDMYTFIVIILNPYSLYNWPCDTR